MFSLDETPYHPSTWESFDFDLTDESGDRVVGWLVRPKWWIEETGAREGETIYLAMPEFGIEGRALVKNLLPSTAPEPTDPRYKNVIGKFERQNVSVVDLKFEGEDVLLGVTPSHPLFSADRQTWVEAGMLRIGERVATVDGSAILQNTVPRPGLHTVYNLEVHQDHTYFVGGVGLLAHNFCDIRRSEDALGRVRSAFAEIRPIDIGAGTGTNRATRGASRSLGSPVDDAGHIIGKLLGGPGGKGAGNFFPQNVEINRGLYRDFEGLISDEVQSGKKVFVRVNLRYSGASTRPDLIIYQARIDGETITRQFPNP